MGEKPLKIDLHSILKERMSGKLFRFIPGFIITSLTKIIRQDELNEILSVTFPARGSEFSRKVLNHLGITVEVKGLENILERKRLMFASNHPLGGLDGITLIAVLGEKFGDDGIRFLVNDMLMNVEPLKEMFLPINKYGKQGREATKAINTAMASEMQIFQFPAGLCSRMQSNGEIKDLEWQKSFISKAIEYDRDIVPVYFEGKNTDRFYKTARMRKKLGIKFNIEQALLPSELCKAKGSHYRIIFGSPIKNEELKKSGKPLKELAAEIRERVYTLRESNPEL